MFLDYIQVLKIAYEIRRASFDELSDHLFVTGCNERRDNLFDIHFALLDSAKFPAEERPHEVVGVHNQTFL